jgi:ABC-type transport system involved in multi-copper enzyme maturation permease subunit
MPVDQASYRGWEGVPRPGRRAALAIAGTMIRRMRRGLLVRYLVFGVPAASCLIGVGIFALTYLLEEQSPLRSMIMRRGGGSMLDQINLLEVYNRSFAEGVALFAVIVAALVGAPLIAEDRRTRALALYFSRPISHFDYVAGKLLTVAFFLGIMLLAPPVLTYVAEVALSPKEGVLLDQLPVLGRSLVPNLARLVVLSAIALAVSSLMRKTTHAVLLTFGLLFFALTIANILSHGVFDDPAWLAISPGECVRRVAQEFLPYPEVINIRESGLAMGTAWLGLAAWTGASLAILVAKVRRVEVVA